MNARQITTINNHIVEEFYWNGKNVTYIDGHAADETYSHAVDRLRKQNNEETPSPSRRKPPEWMMIAAKEIHREIFGIAPCDEDRIDPISIAYIIEKSLEKSVLGPITDDEANQDEDSGRLLQTSNPMIKHILLSVNREIWMVWKMLKHSFYL